MNLIGDPWISVVMQDGQPHCVGLCDLFRDATEIRDLALNPSQRISVMRLLICIAQVALDGPADDGEWRSCRDRIVSESLAYLDRYSDRFNLFGAHAFLQIPGLTTKNGVPNALVDKLDFGLSAGNNDTLFDHESAEGNRAHDPAWAALNLLTYQNFSPGGLIGDTVWNGKPFSKSGKSAPCIQSAHTFIRGSNMLETLHGNILTKSMISSLPNGVWGVPVWECFPESTSDTPAFKNASETYLGRLVPVSRYMKLSEPENGGRDITSCMIGTTGGDNVYEPFPVFREPSTTVLLNRENEPYCLPVTPEKHIWRELVSILTLEKTSGYGKAAPVIQSLMNHQDDCTEDYLDIWVGGLSAEQARIVDACEWSVLVDHRLLHSSSLAIYSKGVSCANTLEGVLRMAVRGYYSDMNAYTGRESRKTVTKILTSASTDFWNALDRRYEVLMDIAATESDDDGWRKLCLSTMYSAYRHACPHETPRQMQAYTHGVEIINKRLNEYSRKGGTQ